MVEEALAERAAFPRVTQSVLQGLLSRADRHAGGNQPLILEVAHDVIEAFAFLANQVLPWDARVLEYQLSGVGAVIAKLLQLFRQTEARGVTLDDEHRDTLVGFIFLGFGGDTEHIGMDRIGDENLGTVQHIRVAVPDRGRLNASHVRTSRWLGDADRTDLLALNHRHQILLSLLLSPMAGDVGRGHVGVHQDAHRQAHRPTTAHLLTESDGHPNIAVAATVLLRVADAEEAQFAHPSIERLGKQSLLFPLVDMWNNFLVDEIPHLLAEHLVFFGEKAGLRSQRSQW